MEKLHSEAAREPCPVNVLPGEDWRVVTEGGGTAGWVVRDSEASGPFEVYDSAGNWLEDALSLSAAVAIIGEARA